MSSTSFHVALLCTAPRGSVGSMTRYAEMVQQALSNAEGATDKLRVTRIDLALPENLLACVPSIFRNWLHHAWVTISTKRRAARCSADMFHILDGSHAYLAGHLPAEVPVVATAHDIIPFLQISGRLGGPVPSMAGRWLVRKSLLGLQQMDALVCVSESTRRDLLRFVDVPRGKIHVVNNALALSDGHSQAPAARRFVLHVGNDSFYKNRAAVLRVFGCVQARCPDIFLKVVGPSPSAELLRIVQRHNLGACVEFLPAVDDDQLRDFYGQASLFLFPSLYEGFGWPPLEAMACGCPVVCSNAGSLSEVVGDAALTCKAEDEEQMAQHCISVLQDPSTAERLIARGRARAQTFSVERMRRDLIEVYKLVRAES